MEIVKTRDCASVIHSMMIFLSQFFLFFLRVTDAERVEVNIFRRKMNEMNQFNVTRNSKLKSDVIVRSDDRSNMEPNALSNIKELLSSHARGTRCFMEISFLEIDRRRKGTVEEEDFWRIMQLYGHSQLLNDREKELLMKRYRKVVKMKAVSAMGVICKTMVNYIDFCRDMLPVTQRIIHDSNAWRTERAPKVSVSTAALGLYVRTIREHQRVEESNLKKFSSRTQYNKRPVEMSVIEFQSSDSGLDAWEAGELSRIISSMDAPPVAEKERKKPPMKSAPPSSLSTNSNSNSSGGGDSGCTLMTREQCDSVFERFKELGKVPVLDSTHCLDMIFDHIAVGPTVSSILFRAAVGCPQCPRKVTVLPTVSNAVLAQKSRKLEPAADVRPVTVGPVVDPTGEITSNRQRNKVLMKWRGVTERESVAMDRAVTERAGGLLDSLLHAKDPSSKAALTAEAMKLGLIASRIGGQRIIKSIPKVQSTPGEVTTAASNRADIIVLPNLKTSLSASTKLSSSPSFSTSDYQKMGESRSSSGRATKSMSCEMPSFTSSFSSNLHSTGWAPGTVTIVLG